MHQPETNPQDFKATKNFSLRFNLLRFHFFYKASEKSIKRKWQSNHIGKSGCSVLGRVASEFLTFNDDEKHLLQIIHCPDYFIFINFRPE